jgi:hypothetical protein
MRAAHEHAWGWLDLALEGERPFVRQRCACGAVRSIRAWERYWDPGAPGPGGDGSSGEGAGPGARDGPSGRRERGEGGP